jgi:hypothetical protein
MKKGAEILEAANRTFALDRTGMPLAAPCSTCSPTAQPATPCASCHALIFTIRSIRFRRQQRRRHRDSAAVGVGVGHVSL